MCLLYVVEMQIIQIVVVELCCLSSEICSVSNNQTQFCEHASNRNYTESRSNFRVELTYT